ncbi:081L [Invertebrate iridescent virus 6]|uniref:081L n=1 Tax=Invertebrate iridescent virus 6 TaxID=176652 RepID=Q91G29_IIV6|nr:081L [Invertebrate iridescent virus 6]AAK82003.1 081L [Invertebrate iridescent virus 6]
MSIQTLILSSFRYYFFIIIFLSLFFYAYGKLKYKLEIILFNKS